MDGIAVAYGETISRTGSMLVRADTQVTVTQNGVEWVPIGTVEGAQQFVIGSPGRISINANGKELFFFSVEFAPDFVFVSNNMRQYRGTERLESIAGGPNYCQSRFRVTADKLTFSVRPSSITSQQLLSVATSCNQEVSVSARLSGESSELVAYDIVNFDNSNYLQFFVGNVLLGFLAAKN